MSTDRIIFKKALWNTSTKRLLTINFCSEISFITDKCHRDRKNTLKYRFYLIWMGKTTFNDIWYMNAPTFCILWLYWHTFPFFTSLTSVPDVASFWRFARWKIPQRAMEKSESYSVSWSNPVSDLRKVNSYFEKACIKNCNIKATASSVFSSLLEEVKKPTQRMSLLLWERAKYIPDKVVFLF